jgi:hypothetical protein
LIATRIFVSLVLRIISAVRMAWALGVRFYIVGRTERIVVVNRVGSLNLLVTWCREAVGGACCMGLQAFA